MGAYGSYSFCLQFNQHYLRKCLLVHKSYLPVTLLPAPIGVTMIVVMAVAMAMVTAVAARVTNVDRPPFFLYLALPTETPPGWATPATDFRLAREVYACVHGFPTIRELHLSTAGI